jgi:hypothetical protein
MDECSKLELPERMAMVHSMRTVALERLAIPGCRNVKQNMCRKTKGKSHQVPSEEVHPSMKFLSTLTLNNAYLLKFI